MKEIVCACCGKKIEEEYMKVLDNFLLVKYFDTDEESIFCSDECLKKSLSVETFYLDDNYEWLDAFQKYCDSDEIREESAMNGINACGYGIQCDCCDGDFERNYCCARAMIEYCKKKNIEIDYLNTTNEYFRKLLLGKTGKEE